MSMLRSGRLLEAILNLRLTMILILSYLRLLGDRGRSRRK